MGVYVVSLLSLLAIDVGGSKKGCSGAEFSNGSLTYVYPELRRAVSAVQCVAVERPQQDGRSRSVPPSVLIDLAWTGALLVGAYKAHGATIVEYEPREWKGEVPKAVHHARFMQALGVAEISVLDAAFPGFAAGVADAVRKGALCRWRPDANGHYPRASRLPDVLDAVGLGLYHLGKITKEGKPK